MSDNNYELEYKTPMNDLPEHGEVITKKPYYDNGSTLTPLPQGKNETKQPIKNKWISSILLWTTKCRKKMYSCEKWNYSINILYIINSYVYRI